MVIQNGLNCMPYKDRGKSHTYIYARDQFVKNISCGYKMVTVIRVRLTAVAIGDRMVTVKGGRASRRKAGSLSEAGSPYIEK